MSREFGTHLRRGAAVMAPFGIVGGIVGHDWIALWLGLVATAVVVWTTLHMRQGRD